MLNNNRLLFRTARNSSRGGFTLVELLVVIGIIAILAGVALGPITNGIKKAKESAGVQESHAIGLAMFSFANDNTQTYPDGSGSPGVPAGNATAGAAGVAIPLLAGGYVSDPSIYYISGGASTKYTGTTAAATTSLTSAMISWDFAGNKGAGLNSSNAPYLPLLWNSITGGTAPVLTAGGTSGAVAITCIPLSTNAYGTAGVAVFYINNSAAFIPSSLGGGSTLSVTMVPSSSNAGGASANASVLAGGG